MMLAAYFQTFTLYRPILTLLSGVCFSIAAVFYFAQPLAFVIGLVAILLAVIAWFWQQFFFMGICAGLAAMSFNIALPYQQTFTDCRYQAVLQQSDYSRNRRGSMVRLAATDIVCLAANRPVHLAANATTPLAASETTKSIQLPNQTLQYWDYQGQLRHIGAKKLLLRSQLQPVRSRLNPLTMDYERYLLGQGIRLAAKDLHIIETQSLSWGLPRLRYDFSQAINNHLSADNAAIILALVTGNRSKLSERQRLMMQQTGTSHILAISGLHLALIGGLAWLIFQGLWALSSRLSDAVPPIQAGGVAALVVISGYALLTGFNLPVQRAWLMFSLLIISWLWLRAMGSHSLLLAAVVILLVDPYAFLSIGFYYSFIATYIVLWCVQLKYSPLVKIILMQCLINLALLPITWWAFGMISLSAFFVNVLIIPWLGLWVLPWAMLACCLTLLSTALAQPLWELLEFSTTAMWQVIQLFQQLPLTITPDYRPVLAAVVVAVVAVILALVLRQIYWLLGLLGLLLPLSFSTSPTMIIADSRYTSVLIHNGTNALIINPGYHYKRRNEADKWQRYLQQHQLQLAAIVLQDDKLNHISATASLLKNNPNTSVITLARMDLPYQQQYCQPLALANLQLTVTDNNHCQATLYWYGQPIALFPTTDLSANSAANVDNNAVLNASQVIWQSKHYDAQQLGALQIKKAASTWQVSYQRQAATLWRLVVP